MIMSFWPTSFTVEKQKERERGEKREERPSPEQNKENKHMHSLKRNKIIRNEEGRKGGIFFVAFVLGSQSVSSFCRQNLDSNNILSLENRYTQAVQ